jgi:hypothetical protein
VPALLKKSNTDWIVCQLVNYGKTITWKGQNGWKCYGLGSEGDSRVEAAHGEALGEHFRSSYTDGRSEPRPYDGKGKSLANSHIFAGDTRAGATIDAAGYWR